MKGSSLTLLRDTGQGSGWEHEGERGGYDMRKYGDKSFYGALHIFLRSKRGITLFDVTYCIYRPFCKMEGLPVSFFMLYRNQKYDNVVKNGSVKQKHLKDVIICEFKNNNKIKNGTRSASCEMKTFQSCHIFSL